MSKRITMDDIITGLDSLETRPRPPGAKRKVRQGRPTSPRVRKLKPMRVLPGALSDSEVIQVRQLHALGMSYIEIQAKFDDRETRPSLSALKHICRGLRRAKVK